MQRFNVELHFYLEEGDDHATVKELFTWLARHYDAVEYDKADRLCSEVVTEYPFQVIVDAETWRSVDRTSRDSYLLRVELHDALLTDDALEGLADVDRMVDAAVWAIRNNEYVLNLTSLTEYDEIQRIGQRDVHAE